MRDLPRLRVIEATATGAGVGSFDGIRSVIDAAWELVRRRSLVGELAWRAVRDRYRASFLGLLWAILTPLLLLAVYTLVFATVFTPRFDPSLSRSPYSFGVVLFSALIPFNYFVEAVASAPSLVVGQVSYVKRVVFPLHALPLVSALAGLFHAGVGLLLFVIAALAVMGHLPATALMLPLVWVPLVGLTLGLVYILAALGVFLRDLGQVIGPILSAMFFLSPVFYPAASMPEVLRPFYRINPVGVVVENTRRVLVMGLAPEWKLLGLWSVGGVGLLMLGFAGFVRCRRAFNDVL